MTVCPCFKFCDGQPGPSVTCKSTELRRDDKGRIRSLHCAIEHNHVMHGTIFNGAFVGWFDAEKLDISV